jgi:hypothetical protein
VTALQAQAQVYPAVAPRKTLFAALGCLRRVFARPEYVLTHGGGGHLSLR